ncbi:MAG: hypothetical protein K9I59_09515 [Chlorobium sp.]|nr:hypothetical protein [Chlorobium sp.]MCF8271870.1 hypothetical protein [Chlorobium sp.]MCF8288276.1 hypothetical protein [Chlorobium sp.]MCF8291822.1 hypothetical protein [Chlorobium sp.]MCF8385976.1 hypothetical protein [Chlorobium sp.]
MYIQVFPETCIRSNKPLKAHSPMNRKRALPFALLLAGLMLAPPAASAAETLEERVIRLEKELAELKTLVGRKPSAPSPIAAAPAAPAAPAANPAPPTGIAVTTSSGVRAQLYGFARLDASYDTGQIYPGNIALWAQPENGADSDGEWNLTAGATRLGINLSGPDSENLKLSGNIELDFLGGGTENNLNPRLRHGYLKAYWPASDFSIIAGQTWDLVSSLIPFVDDPGMMWASGNIGTRHPQLRLTKGFAVGEKNRLEIAAAASRTIGEKNSLGIDTGKDADMPTVQGRIALSAPLSDSGKPATIAMSGHYGQEEWDSNKLNHHETIDSWSCNVELSIPLGRKFILAGEYFTGSNLDDYWGGVFQGVNAKGAKPEGIRSSGGWAALRYAYSPAVTISLGGGFDDPENGDLSGMENPRTFNRSLFAAYVNQLTPNFVFGLQLSKWDTGYLNTPDSDAVRAQSSMTYRF